MNVRFGYVDLNRIKPGKTGYFVGHERELKPGATIHVIRELKGESQLFDPNRGYGPLKGQPTAKERHLTFRRLLGELLRTGTIQKVPKESADLSMHACRQQSFVVDNYTVQPDGQTVKLTGQNESALGFNPYTDTNSCVASATLKGDQLQVGDRVFRLA